MEKRIFRHTHCTCSGIYHLCRRRNQTHGDGCCSADGSEEKQARGTAGSADKSATIFSPGCSGTISNSSPTGNIGTTCGSTTTGSACTDRTTRNARCTTRNACRNARRNARRTARRRGSQTCRAASHDAVSLRG